MNTLIKALEQLYSDCFINYKKEVFGEEGLISGGIKVSSSGSIYRKEGDDFDYDFPLSDWFPTSPEIVDAIKLDSLNHDLSNLTGKQKTALFFIKYTLERCHSKETGISDNVYGTSLMTKICEETKTGGQDVFDAFAFNRHLFDFGKEI